MAYKDMRCSTCLEQCSTLTDNKECAVCNAAREDHFERMAEHEIADDDIDPESRPCKKCSQWYEDCACEEFA